MMVFGFSTAQAIRFGRGVRAEAAPAARALGTRALVVHGASGRHAAPLIAALEAEGCTVTALPCGAEPDVAAVGAAVALARGADVQVVLGIGGGSVIDLAKATAALAPAPGDLFDHLEVVGKGQPLVADPLPVIALPTTAGTGAEVTRNAVIGVPDHGRKVSLRDARMLPRLALVDPGLTDGMPRAVTLASGLDAVVQVIEPYVSCRANPLTDALCVQAIPRGAAALARLMQAEDPQARDDLALCSLYGGLALANSGLGAVHGLAGVLGGVTGAPHGAICGLLLGPVLCANAAALPGHARLAEVADWLRAAFGVGPEGLLDHVRALGLPGLGAMGLDPAAIGQVAAASAVSSSMKGNPVPLPPEVLGTILRAAL